MFLDNIKVMVRVRPLLQKELEVSDFETLRVLDTQTLQITSPEELASKQTKKTFQFNWVFDRLTSQKDIFEACLEYQTLCVLDGYNYTLFSYGGQSTGKTHTILKTSEDYGLLIRILNRLFSSISAKKRKVKVFFSYVEIYQENLADLLNNTNLTLEIREDPIKGIVVAGARECEVASTQETLNLLAYGKKHKNKLQIGHDVLIFSFQIFDSPGLTTDVTISKLIVADLTSLERGGHKNHNISLINLRACIQCLNEAQNKHTQPFVPYRNSKLTRILKESLGGNSKTLLAACLSPAVTAYEDSLQTLDLSTLAMGVQTSVQIKKIQFDQATTNYQQIIEQLRSENQELKKILSNKQYVVPSLLNTEEDYIRHYEELIINHYNNEQDVSNQHFNYTWEGQILRFRIQENQVNLQGIDGIDLKKGEQLRQQLELDQNQLEKYETHIRDLTNAHNHQKEQRKALEQEIKESSVSETGKLYLSSLLNQHALKVENLEIKHKEELNILNKQQHERELAILRSQISLRDQIITSQKHHINSHLKNHSIQHFSQIDTTVEVLEGTTAKLRHYPLPKIKDHYFNKEAFLNNKLKQSQNPRTQKDLSPRQELSRNSPAQKKSPLVPRAPNVRILQNLSTPALQIEKPKVLTQKPIDSVSMVMLPKIQANRNLAKFVYDWKSGGYKLVQESPKKDSEKAITQSREIQSRDMMSLHTQRKGQLDETFFSGSSRSSRRRLSPSRYLKAKVAGQVHESPYVRGFIKDEVQRKYRLFELNQKFKKMKK